MQEVNPTRCVGEPAALAPVPGNDRL